VENGLDEHRPEHGESKAIGVDIGGTKIAVGIVAADGRLLDLRRIVTREVRDFSLLLTQVAETVGQLHATMDGADEVVDIGVAACELVNRDGEVCSATSIPWTRADLVDALSPFGRVTIEADVRASALAEGRFGAGLPFASFVHVTVGTGISCCLVRDSNPDPGAHGFAQLIGSAPLTFPLEEPGSSATVVLEDVASGPALARRYRARAAKTVSAAEDVIALAQDGDAIAVAVVEEAGKMLGSFVALLVNVLDPEAVVMGGGLGSADGLFWETTVASTRAHIWSEHVRPLPITRAHLGANAALIGAGLVGLARGRAEWGFSSRTRYPS
jgi:glucokinase